MWLLRKIAECYFPLFYLSIVGFMRVKSIEMPETTRHEIVNENSPRNQYAVREETTTASLRLEKLTSPIVVQALPRNNSNVFRPSVHLGEIEQPSVRSSPFNNIQHVKFENNVQLDARYERFQNVLQDTHQSVSSMLDEATRSSRIKFQDDGIVQTSSIQHPFGDQQIVTESSVSPFGETDVKHVLVDQNFFQNIEKPREDMSKLFGKSMSDPRLTTYFDASRSPYVIGYYTSTNQNAYQPVSQDTGHDMMKKPENGVLLLQESTYTRKRKFPYQFYQPTSGYHNVEYTEEPRQSEIVYSRMRKMSPWKKLIHLIGTFLPLGLLLATLTPNVVRVDNTTQPNIILSKLRAADLPVEHKRARLLDDLSVTCEDRSMCELILAGSEPESNILQNILWNLATRISDDVARKNGLREVFNAVKKKDCTIIKC